MTQIPERRPFGVGFSIGITILAFGILLLSLLWGGVVLKVRIEEKAEFTEVTKHTANLARAVEEHAVRTIREADQVLLFLQHQYRMQGSKPDLRQLIEDGPILSRIYTYLSIIDEHGNLAAGSQPFKPVNLSDREHFQVHVARDILNQPFISKPVVGRASGKSSIQITRRINKPDLSFGGVAVVSIDPDYLSQFYSQLDIGKHGVATLVGPRWHRSRAACREQCHCYAGHEKVDAIQAARNQRKRKLSRHRRDRRAAADIQLPLPAGLSPRCRRRRRNG